jgi:hypothetical protein
LNENERTAVQLNRALRSRSGGLLAFVFAAFAMIHDVGATSSNTDVTDIWWNPAEPGWGLQMVNTGTFVFATGYIYGVNGEPLWVTGELSRIAADLVTFTGPLYITTGPYFGGPFNPNAVNSRRVGTMTFVLNTVSVGQLTYTVDGVPVSKTVQRQPLTLDNYNGSYVAVVTQTAEGCSNPANNGTSTSAGTVRITQNGSSMVVVTNLDGITCTSIGSFAQLGRMGRLQGTYSCTTGEVGNAVVFEMNNVPYMFTARLQSQSTNVGCSNSGEVAGLIPR